MFNELGAAADAGLAVELAPVEGGRSTPPELLAKTNEGAAWNGAWPEVGVVVEAGGVPPVDGDKCAGRRLWAPGNNDDPLKGGEKGRFAWNGKGGSGELLIDIDAVYGRRRKNTESGR